MISCTEFVPLYSDFFTYLDNFGGHAEVEKYWAYVSEHRLGDKNNPRALIYYLEHNDPFLGARLYWGGTLSEEKSDYCSIVDTERKFSISKMRRCPSKGKLITAKNLVPYYDYCGHCPAIFTGLLARYGLGYEMNLTHSDRAECTMLLYELGKRPDERELVMDESRASLDVKAEDNEYFHPGFHISCDIALRYCGELFGREGVVDFLEKHTRGYYRDRITDARERGVSAIADWLVEYYALEHASERLHLEKEGGTLTVVVDSDPALDFMREMNHTPSEYHSLRTSVVLETVAADAGLEFKMEYYDEKGGTRFVVREK